jgi:hypothetical protein
LKAFTTHLELNKDSELKWFDNYAPHIFTNFVADDPSRNQHHGHNKSFGKDQSFDKIGHQFDYMMMKYINTRHEN